MAAIVSIAACWPGYVVIYHVFLCAHVNIRLLFIPQYSLGLIVFIISELAIGVSLYDTKSRANFVVTQNWASAAPITIVTIQNESQCCGLHTYNTTSAVPCPSASLYPNSVGQACMTLVLASIESAFSVIALCILVVAFLQVLYPL